MRYALISDIHANVEALHAVLADIAQRDEIAATYHLGDLVGYSSSPNEVVDLLRSANIAGVAGNYDSTVAAGYKHCGCRAATRREEELAHVSYEWTRAHISASTTRFLGGLPFRIDLRPRGGHVVGPTVTLVHATPTNNLVYVTEDRTDEFLLTMAKHAGVERGDVLCFGHTHKPWFREVAGITFVNTGSVGRPKDGDWRAGYVLLDVRAATEGVTALVRVEVVRVEYAVETTIAGVRAAGLPEDFAEFLRTGGKAASSARDAS